MGSFVQLENAVRPEGVKIHRPIRLPKTRPILPPTERLAGGKIRRTCRNSREGGYGSLPGIVDKPGLPDWIIRRAGTPQDVADLVKFLVTQAPYLTGQIFRLDGGRSIT